jgi:hypothetical protein
MKIPNTLLVPQNYQTSVALNARVKEVENSIDNRK